MAEPLPLTAWRPTTNSFTVTLPRPVGSFEEGEPWSSRSVGEPDVALG